MKLLMLTALAGSNFSVAMGDVVSHYDDTEAGRWVAAEFAEEAPAKAKVTVVILPPEAEPLPLEVQVIDGSSVETTADDTTVETTADETVVETR